MKDTAKRVARRYGAAAMNDLNQARKAKDSLREKLQRPAWLRGVGVGVDVRGSYCVKVLVEKMSDAVSALPREVEGVPVEVEVVGDILLL